MSSGLPRTTSASGQNGIWPRRPTDFKSDALTTRPRCLPIWRFSAGFWSLSDLRIQSWSFFKKRVLKFVSVLFEWRTLTIKVMLTLQKDIHNECASLVICTSFKKRKPMGSDRNCCKICYPSNNVNQNLIWTTKWRQSKQYLDPEFCRNHFILSVKKDEIHLLLCYCFSAFSKCCDINDSHILHLLYGSVSQGLGTTKFYEFDFESGLHFPIKTGI